MALCINDSGTYRNITTLCINDSGTYRNIVIGCINDSGNWRKFGGPGTAPTTVGSSFGGGSAICLAGSFACGGVVWIVSPYASEVSRDWYNINDANTTAQSVSGCTGWFVPAAGQLQNPGYCCRSFWGPSPCYSSTTYWSITERNASRGCGVFFTSGGIAALSQACKQFVFCVRSFRCVTY